LEASAHDIDDRLTELVDASRGSSKKVLGDKIAVTKHIPVTDQQDLIQVEHELLH
jgi:hypothetical protein